MATMNTLATPQTATTTWNLDPVHSAAEFKVKHMMISNVKGQFTTVKGVLALDEADLTNSHVEASIEAASIDTRDAQRYRGAQIGIAGHRGSRRRRRDDRQPRLPSRPRL